VQSTASLTFSKELTMPKATKMNSTPTASSARTRTSAADDPAFAAIDRHQKLDGIWLDRCRGEEDGLAKECEVDRAADAAERAAWRMARTKPTTAAGAAELLTYITTGPITGLFELGETHWHETAFRTCAEALARITRRQSQPAA
jgi:hypothetical protein